VAAVRVCPFNGNLCIHPDWADCQFQYSMDDPRYIELFLRGRGEEDKMGRDCCFLPEGISRTEMMEALGAYGEEAKRRVLESVKRGVYGKKKREMYEQRR
jgi:hypothetical protein